MGLAVFGRAARMGLPAALTLALGACSSIPFFGQQEDPPLPGERIPVRDSQSEFLAAPNEVARLSALPAPVAQPDWTTVNGAKTHAPGHIEGPASLNLAWRADAGDGGGGGAAITSGPVVAGGVIYVLDAGSTLSAFSTDTGAPRWRSDLSLDSESGGDGFGGGLAFDGGVLFATTGFGEVLAISPSDGQIVWRQRLGAPVRAAPTADAGRVFAVTRDNTAFALRAETGEILWRLQGAAGGLGLLGGASPAVIGEAIIIPFASGEIVAARASSGARVWTDVLATGRRGVARSIISDITGDPVIAGQGVFAANQSGLLVALEGRGGRRAWTRGFGLVDPVWVAGETLFGVTDDARLVRLAAVSGDTIWETALPQFADVGRREDPIAYGGPVVAGGKAYVTSSDNRLLVFDAVTGERLSEVDISGGASLGPIVAGRTLYVLANDATLYAFR